MTKNDNDSRKVSVQDDDEVQGHRAAAITGEDDDVQGHRVAAAITGEDDDVQGHAVRSFQLTGELDTDRHISGRP